MRRFTRFVQDQRGGTLVEYGLICALVILTMFAALNLFASNTVRMFNNVSNAAGSVL